MSVSVGLASTATIGNLSAFITYFFSVRGECEGGGGGYGTASMKIELFTSSRG